jgi:hypothetical protein
MRNAIRNTQYAIRNTQNVRRGPSPVSRISGYTLVEVLLYAVLLGLFLFLTVQIFITIRLSNAHALAFASLSKNIRAVTADLSQTIKSAQNVIDPLPGQAATSLSLNNGTVTYGLQSGAFQKTENSQTWELTTDEVVVSNLSFENQIEATQEATLTIKASFESNYLLEGGRRLSEELETTISLR